MKTHVTRGRINLPKVREGRTPPNKKEEHMSKYYKEELAKAKQELGSIQ